jgi:3-methyladenine DNA glycosylase AlkD
MIQKTVVDVILTELKNAVTLSPEKSTAWFKTEEGSYAAGDCFIGVTVPDTRAIARKYLSLSYGELETVLDSPYNEMRLLALIILVERFKKSKIALKTEIYNFYLSQLDKINNWNLVDVSAHYIIGGYWLAVDDSMRMDVSDKLTELVSSTNLWHRRVAILCTWLLNRNGHTFETFRLAKLLLSDPEDLIHKATGWMLREAGKKDLNGLRLFLENHSTVMPRTMLRYSIERLEPDERRYYLQK